jgi:UDP-N-acetylmuramoyl-tripeptide--D-alanyl-D-alanine ligase
MRDVLSSDVNVITYGFDHSADITASGIFSANFEGMTYTLETPAGSVEVETPALGRHSVHNGLAAAAVGVATGMDLDAIARGLAREWHAPHRTTVVNFGPVVVIDDSYNAGPDSMFAALDLLGSLELSERRVAILGEMLELGDVSLDEHRRVERYAHERADVVYAVGPYEHAESREKLLREIGDRLRPGDVILIKGSRGAAMEEFLPVLEEAANRMKVSVT